MTKKIINDQKTPLLTVYYVVGLQVTAICDVTREN
jgi:hypothetical protein